MVDVHDEVTARLAALDQRYTIGRRAIIAVLVAADRPLSVPEILSRADPGDVPQSSAYRHLSALVDAGAVHRFTGSDDHGRYELAEDLAGHHHHLLCVECGRMVDVAASARLESALREAAEHAAGDTDFEVTGHRIDLVGRCGSCRAVRPA